MPIQCPFCGQAHQDDTWVCPETQRPLMQVCENCGEWSWVTSGTCPNCGIILPGIAPTETQPTTQMAAAAPPPSSGKSWLYACGGLLALGVVIVVCVGLLGYLQYRFDLLGKVNVAWARPTPTQKLFTTQRPTKTPTKDNQADGSTDGSNDSGGGNQETATHTPTLPFAATNTPTLTESPTPTHTPTLTEIPAMQKKIAFVSDRAGSNDIYVMNTAGSSLVQLTTADSDDRVPSWSPDGAEIAYQSNADGDFELYIINVNTRSIRQLTSNACNDYMPVWSPDGAKFAFYSDCDGNREIYLLNADGSDRKQLTFTSGDTYNWFPTWSPDGSKITYASNLNAKYEVWVMNADGSNAKVVTEGCVPVFSPDGLTIAYTQYCLDVGKMYLIQADGTQKRLISGVYDCRNPGFSPEGNKIVFQSNRSGNDDIWMMNSDGTNWLRLTDNPAYDGAPVWQP